MRKHMLVVPALMALVAVSAIGVAAETTTGGLVTERVEPGVDRIVSDGAGHDLDEKHPTYRYDMDDIAIAPDGTVVLWSTYSRSDNDANPPGGLVWALGQPGFLEEPTDRPYCSSAYAQIAEMGRVWGLGRVLDPAEAPASGYGLMCLAHDGTVTTYLAKTRVNAFAFAPDGTLWVVGGYAGDNGGLYRITLE